ncbi:MAG: hypothetical protein V7636_1044 [Actinomycetota bacterium]
MRTRTVHEQDGLAVTAVVSNGKRDAIARGHDEIAVHPAILACSQGVRPLMATSCATGSTDVVAASKADTARADPTRSRPAKSPEVSSGAALSGRSGANPSRVVRAFLAAIGDGVDVETAATYISDDFDAHMAGMPDLEGRDAWVQMAGSFQIAFPDLDLEITELAVTGDLVCARWRWTATHSGDLMGIPPTGKAVQAEGAGFYRVRDGKIASEWMIEDMLSVMQQVGAVPSAA